MDHFEFILVITSVIFALAVAQILSGISRIAQSSSDVRLYLPHSLWVVNIFVFIFLIWWASWEFRAVEWTFPRYAYMILAPTLLYFSASLLMPQQISGRQFSMEEHFLKVRRPLLVSFFCATLVVMVDGDVMGDEPAWHGGRLGNIAMLALAGWGFATPDRTVQKIVASMTMIVFVALIVLRFWSPR